MFERSKYQVRWNDQVILGESLTRYLVGYVGQTLPYKVDDNTHIFIGAIATTFLF